MRLLLFTGHTEEQEIWAREWDRLEGLLCEGNNRYAGWRRRCSKDDRTWRWALRRDGKSRHQGQDEEAAEERASLEAVVKGKVSD